MKSQACEPCAKRKVRCNREEPCGNCKRRKHDTCTYPDESPFERIRKLEALVRDLGGDTESDASTPHKRIKTAATASVSSPSTAQTPLQQNSNSSTIDAGRSKDPVVLEEDGEAFYLESHSWHDWSAHYNNQDTPQMTTKNPYMMRKCPHALESIMRNPNGSSLSARYHSARNMAFLWNTYFQRVNPIVRISFDWKLRDLQRLSLDVQRRESLNNAQHSYVFAIFLICVISLSEEECQKDLNKSRSTLLLEFQLLCEEALSRTSLFCITDITVLKALTIYLMAGIDRLSTQSLWSLMGLILRNAERLGIHRDGTLLGLGPTQTEERRRLWWQLQHLDLALAVKCSVTPMTLMADWDVKLPLNIEDEDISEEMTEMPHQRKGLTGTSYHLYTAWVIDFQRRFFQAEHGRFELSWQSNKSLSFPLKESLIQQLEDGLNSSFLQYCDPTKPINILMQLSARALVCLFRLRTAFPAQHISQQDKMTAEQREEILKLSIQCLEYSVMGYFHPLLKSFQWLIREHFTWHAFLCILIEASRETDASRLQQIWDLLSNLYTGNPKLWQLAEDRRNSYAARLVVAAWKSREKKQRDDQDCAKPAFVAQLESQLSSKHAEITNDPMVQRENRVATEEDRMLGNLNGSIEDQDAGFAFELDFPDIDWNFWSSID